MTSQELFSRLNKTAMVLAHCVVPVLILSGMAVSLAPLVA
jgi:hypothetical protein